jgi:hypothetical protein
MTSRRAAAALVASAVVAITALVLVPGDARALTGSRLTIPAKQTVEVDEPAIPSNDPATTTAGAPPDPETCASVPSCAVIPLTIEVPQRNVGDDFVVYVDVSWSSQTVSDNNVQPVQSNDMDVWIYDDGQTEKAKDSSGYTEIGSSASSDNPEEVKLFEPLLGQYNLVVNNFSGANTGFHIKAVSTVGVFEKPFESLSPGPNSGSVNPHNKPMVTTTAPPPTMATTTTVTIASGADIPDDDFQGSAFAPERSSFDADLAAGQRAASALRTVGSKASSPSAMTVIGWMLLFPLALAGAVIAGLRARKRGLRLKRRAATP